MKSLRFLIAKEFKQMMRNRILPVIFVLLPLLLMNSVPRIATQEIKGLKFAIVDNDHSSLSERLTHKIDASSYLDLAATCHSHKEAMMQMESGNVDVIIEIPHNYERGMVTGNPEQLGILTNATNGVKGSMATTYVTMIAQSHAVDIMDEMGKEMPAMGGNIQTMFLFNTHLDYRLYMIPAIFGLLLTLIVGFLPALNIVSEKERGTIEQMNVTPVGKLEFVLSKLVPYWTVGIVMSVLSLGAARGIYGFMPAGNIGTFFLFISLFCLLVSAVGLVISNYSNTTQQAALTMYFFLVIFILMSGLLTPIRSMPEWAQWFTLANPMRHIIEAMRSIYIKGSTIAELRQPLIYLTSMACVFGVWAIVSYKKNQ